MGNSATFGLNLRSPPADIPEVDSPEHGLKLQIISSYMLSTLDITLPGGFYLSCADKPVVGVTTERPQALLAYLVLHRDISQTRQRLAFQFWADSTEAQACTNLRRELHHLRRAAERLRR